MTKAEFHEAHGAEWAEFTSRPSFFAAMQLVSANKLESISKLTDEQISEHGKEILADFRGHINVENALIDLAVSSPENTFDMPPETYGANTPLVDDPESNSTAFVSFQKAPKPKKKKSPNPRG